MSGRNPGNGNGNGGGPPDNRGPPDDVPGRGPRERVRKKFRDATRNDDGCIEVSGDSLEQLASQVDWDSLSPFEEWALALLEERGLLDE